MKPAVLATVFFAFTLSAAQADQCMDQAADQATMTRCAAQGYQTSDAELNRLFHEIRQRLGDDADARQLLREAERAWIAYRDAECGFAALGVAGGSAYAMIYDMCLDGLTQRRIDDFRQYLSCEEGDLSCPVPPAD